MRTLFIVFLFLLLFAGCDSIVESEPEVAATGYIRELGLTTYQYGTHKLVDSQGTTLYVLSSDKYDLNVYWNMEVSIGGKKRDIGIDGPEWAIVSNVQVLTIYAD